MEEYIENVEGPIFPGINCPATICCSGVSGSGKTSLVHKVLRHKDEMFQLPVHKVLYCRQIDQNAYSEMRADVPG